MKKHLINLLVLSCLTTHANEWQEKASPTLLAQLAQSEQIDMILTFSNSTEQWSATTPAKGFTERLAQQVKRLKKQARDTQQPVIDWLNQHDLAHRSFWVNNSLLVTANREQMATLLAFNEVSYAYSNQPHQLTMPANYGQAPRAVGGIEWNVSMVRAPQVWNLGYSGQGIVVAGQDTGYQWNHPVLINQYRGWDGQTADHNHNWHDSINNPQVTCGAAPCDDHTHGSHTMGTIVGDDGNTNQVGVAPGARWIGCRNMDLGNGTPATYTECFQWFMEPTDLNGANPDVSKAPHIINNSWGCPVLEGCTEPNVLLSAVQNVVDAGILVVVSAGNDGSGCQSINTPAGTYEPSFTVGSTNSNDTISGFSSRGNITVDGSGRLKPDLTAPGSSVRSANNTGGYVTLSGTSMAGPNVAGVAALVMSANPLLAGRPRLMKHILTATSIPKTTAQNCGGVSGSTVPNNTYGHGRIDALNAVNYATDLIHFDDFEGL